MTPSLRVDRLVIDAPGLPDDDAHALAWLIAEHLGRLSQVPGGIWPGAAITRAPGEGPDQLARRIAEHLARRLFEEAGR
jgi:hypothetical protein